MSNLILVAEPSIPSAVNGHHSPKPALPKNYLTPLGEKIFLDRYAWKDGSKKSLAVGDTIIVCVDQATRQREIGIVEQLDREADEVVVRLRDDSLQTVSIDHIDKPLETKPAQTMARIAKGIAKVEPEEQQAEWEERFRWLLEDWKFVPGGRIWAGAGTDQNLTYYNCYVVPSPHDSRGGIVNTLSQMTEIMSRGGGVGINISSLRPRYSYVKGVNGRSSGAVSWGGLYSFVTGLIEQGGSRRGALMLICNDWHPDVLEFISSKRKMGQITNANISVGISDGFMDAVKADGDWNLVYPDMSMEGYDEIWDGNLEKWKAAGHPVIKYKTIKARDMWNQIIESAWASAEPGLWFRERSNKMSNSWYFNPLISTNPCVTGDTLIYTSEGLISAQDLFEQGNKLEVVTDGRFGVEESTTNASHVFHTGRKQVYRLETKEGYSLRATADHRIMTPSGWVELGKLQPGDQIHILNRKGGFGTEGSLELGQVLGWLVGDGTIKQDRAVLSFFGDEKQELAPMFAQNVNTLVAPMSKTGVTYKVGVVDITQRDEARVQSVRLRTIAQEHGLTDTKHSVPEMVFQGSEAMQRGFLQALFTADGSVQDGGQKGASIRLASSYLELIENCQKVLLNFGIASRIYRNRRDAGYRELPDGKGGTKEYWCRAQHELVITKRNMVRFAEDIGFLMDYKQSALEDYITRGKRGPYKETFIARVKAITPEGIEDVYDLTEPLTHSFVANGITVHNCGEQPLPAFSVCNLGAVNLAKFVKEGELDWSTLGQTVRYAVRFLDNVISATPYFLQENADQQLSERRVGLGVMGLAEMLIRLGLRYGSPEGNKFLDRLFRFFAREAYSASSDIAAEKGSFSHFDAEKFLQSGYMQKMPGAIREKISNQGVRNVTLLTVAPTGTTGTMVNTSTGIEPYYFWSYYRQSRLGMHEEVVEVVRQWREAHPGEELPDHFVTAMDLAPEEHVRVQAAVQQWIDSSISKTCNVPNDYTIEQTAELYELMYELGCKGGTIYRDGSRSEQVLHLKEEDKKEEDKKEQESSAPAATPYMTMSPNYTNRGEHKRTRPSRLKGSTYAIESPVGKAYVTVNRNGNDQPFEVFSNVGKAGSEVMAMSEAIGRMISLMLRIPSHISPNERLEMVVEQLEDIGGARSVGFGPNRVKSLPDALAKVLRENIDEYREENAADLLSDMDTAPRLTHVEAKAEVNGHANDHVNSTRSNADLCPECGHASFVRIEGCQKCYSCGYSEC